MRLLFLFLLIVQPAWALDYYVNNTNGAASNSNLGTSPSLPWLTIGKCAATIVAGDTCNVLAGSYNERAIETTDGAANARIQYLASPGVKVRGFTVNGGDYVTIEGFEFTSQGMTYEFDRTISIINAAHTLILNNTIHDTVRACIAISGTSFAVVRKNTGSYCGESRAILGTLSGTKVITAGVNDRFKYNVGGASQTITIPAGTYANSSQWASLNSQLNALMPAGASVSFTAFGNFAIYAELTGATSVLTLEAVPNNVFATFGWTVGSGVMHPNESFITGTLNSTDTLIEENYASYVADYFTNANDARVVIRNNVWGPVDPISFHHVDGAQTNGSAGTAFLLYEGNVSVGNRNPDNHIVLFQRPADRNLILRYNTTFQTNGYIDCTRGGNSTTPGLFLYNNTFYNNALYIGSGNQLVFCNKATGNLSRNNAWYNSSVQSPYYPATIIDKDFDLRCCGTGDPVEINDIDADPLFTDGPSGNFRLLNGSPAIDAGGPLASVAPADTGSGAVLVLNNASPFQDGWAGTNPDCLAVGTVMNTACIASIDYATNAITLGSAISRNPGDPVWLYKNSSGRTVLSGSAPDIGALEAGAIPPDTMPPIVWISTEN